MSKRRSLKSIYNYVVENFTCDGCSCTVENFPLIIGKDGITRSYTNKMKEANEKDVKVIGVNKLVLFCSSGDNDGIGILLTDNCNDREIQIYLNLYDKK